MSRARGSEASSHHTVTLAVAVHRSRYCWTYYALSQHVLGLNVTCVLGREYEGS